MGIGVAIGALVSSIAGAASTAVAAIGGFGAIGKAVLTTALSVGVNIASKKLFGPKPPDQKQGRSGNLRTSTMPHHVVLGEVRKGGLIAYVNGSGPSNNNKWLYLAVVVASHEVESMDTLHVGGTETAFDDLDNGNAVGRLHDYAFFKFHTGSPTQAADAVLVAANANWTTAHQFKGRAYVRAELRESPARFPSFIPALTVTMKGAKDIYDPRAGGSTGYTKNPALQAAWVLETYCNVPRARIDQTSLETAADICDESVTIKDLSSVNRYESSGFFELQGHPEDWLDPITRAMAGAVVEHNGNYYIYAGAYTAPVVTITDDDIVGDILYSTARSTLERPNTIKGIFVSPETYDAPAEYIAVTGTAADENEFLNEDNGVENVMEWDLEFCQTHEQARRVASIILRTNRMDETIECDVNLQIGLDVKPWDTVTLNSTVLGINDTFRILDHKRVVDPQGPRAYVTLSLRKVASSIYDWTPASQEKDLNISTPVTPDEPVETTPSVIVGDEPTNDEEQVGSIYLNEQSSNRGTGRGPFIVRKKVEKTS
jgi:hypothetical protein